MKADKREGGSRRRADRKVVVWSGRVSEGDGTRDCVMLNLSASGARVATDQPLKAGCTITLHTEHFGSVVGDVVWARGKRAGIKFSADPEDVATRIAPSLPAIKKRAK